jgi:hypothetical protein
LVASLDTVGRNHTDDNAIRLCRRSFLNLSRAVGHPANPR